MEPLISIIIPVYNAEKYLRQCLDSVVNQTYRNLQILCVDDHSTDQSWQILREYAERDGRFQIYQKENEGVSLARNYALERANGEYLLFVDSDDWVEPDTCEQALAAARRENAQVVLWSYIRELGSESREKRIFGSDIIFEEQAVREKLYRRMAGAYGEELTSPENADALCTVWGKLYRRDVIEENKIRFHDIREIGTYEDGLFNLNVFACVYKAVFLNRHFYHYRRNNDSSLSTAYNPELPQKWNRLFELIGEHIRTHELDESFEKALENRIVLSLIALGINETERKAGAGEKIKKIREILSSRSYREAVAEFEKQYLPLHWKVFFTCAQWNWAGSVYFLLLVIQKIRGR